MVKRGEIWLAALDPTVGSAIQKTRPCIVISPDAINDHLRVVLVAPMTSGSRPASFRVPISFEDVDGLVVPEQARALDKRRLVKRLGAAPDPVMRALSKVLRSFYEE